MAEIWMISPYASPSNYGWHSRTFIMSKYLQSRGYKVTVFSFTGSHYLLLKKGNAIGQKTEMHDGVKFVWFKSLHYKRDSFFTRMLNWDWYNIQLKKYFKANAAKSPESIVFSIPALHQVRLMPLAKKLFPNAKLIFEIRDFWPLSVQELGDYSISNPTIKRLKQAEKIAWRFAEEIIAVQPGINEYVKNEFPKFDISKVHFIPHAYVPEVVFQKEVVFEIGYAGTVSRANDLKTLIEALHILKDAFQFEPKVLIIGTGSALLKVKQLAQGLSNVVFKGWVERKEAHSLLSQCQVCYDGLLNLKMYDYGFSRLKWVDYMLLSKPILVGYSGAEIDVPIDEVGWRVPAESPMLLADKIKFIFLENQKGEIIEKGLQGREFLDKERRMELLGPKYETVLMK